LEGLKIDVQKFMVELVFQQKKGETIKTVGHLQKLDIPSQHWEEVSMDFVTCLPNSKGNNVITVVVDQLTKYAHFRSLSHPSKASTLETKFMQIVYMLHGIPKIIASDRDPIFTIIFGLNYSLVWVLNWLTTPLTILNPMDTLRL
jgi:hypothetical protein